MRVFFGVLFSISSVLIMALLFGGIDLTLFCLLQPLVAIYNHYVVKEYGCSTFLNGLLIISNVLAIVMYKIYYECVYKAIKHGFSWNAVMNEIAARFTIWILIAIAILVFISAVISMSVRSKRYYDNLKKQKKKEENNSEL